MEKKFKSFLNRYYYSQSKTNQKIIRYSLVGIICLIVVSSCIAIASGSRKNTPDIYSNDSNTSDQTIDTIDETESSDQIIDNQEQDSLNKSPSSELYYVERVVDGDTIRINYNGQSTPLRLIGVNTPETKDPRKTVECFGVEASNYLTSLLTAKYVTIESDPTQADRDKYDRLLRYVYLDGEDIGLKIISNGFGNEYTYNYPYRKQAAYKNAQANAASQKVGLWADNACAASNESDQQSGQSRGQECNIKGNINKKGERIYHMPGQKYYDQTQIDTSQGERWFCSEAEAQAAGWRKSKV